MRYAMGIEYDGGDFHGWQRLGTVPDIADRSIQSALEVALSTVADRPVATTCAGRTDSGVHAECQVVHFDSDVARDPRAWTLGVTSRLPAAVAVRWCQRVDGGFHARFSARARRYRYRILNRTVRPALGRQYLSWVHRPLDADAMHAAAQALVGEHDFTTFRTVHCQAAHARRHVHALAVTRDADVVTVDVTANAFLHHMVRNIVGSLLEVGAGRQHGDWIARLLAARDRAQAGATAPSAGLVFVGPRYPRGDGLPAEVTLSGPRA